MANRTIDNVKLGIFVLTGLFLLILFFYMMSKNESIFAARFEIKAHFENVSGLVAGNNVRVSGIVVGIVEEVELVNDTLVIVTIALNNDMRQIVRKNALAALGTDGLIGNRVVNIIPAKEPAPLIEPGDVLMGQKEVSTEEMLRTLDETNQNVLVISRGLMETVDKINKSALLTSLLNDENLSKDLKSSLANLRNASAQASATMQDLRAVVAGVRAGEGSVGTLLRDTTFALELNQAVGKLRDVENQADRLAQNMDALVKEVDHTVKSLQGDINQGPGPANLLMKDSLAAARLQNTLGNLEQGTARFSENMEALKHNFLFRRYFKKQEKKRQKE